MYRDFEPKQEPSKKTEKTPHVGRYYFQNLAIGIFLAGYLPLHLIPEQGLNGWELG